MNENNQPQTQQTKREPWGFCETPEEKCTMNYCDDNGCINRKRNLVSSHSPTEQPGDASLDLYDYNQISEFYKANSEDFDFILPGAVVVRTAEHFLKRERSKQAELVAENERLKGKIDYLEAKIKDREEFTDNWG